MEDFDEVKIDREFMKILERTKKLSFPFFSDLEKKKELILKEKIYLDHLIDQNVIRLNIPLDSRFDRENIWKESKEIAMDKFSSLAPKQKINSFSFQELMHEYAYNQIKTILQIMVENSIKNK